MPMQPDDRVEREIRRRMADLMSAAGVDSGRMSLEVLYLLPEGFVRQYRALFDRALRWDPSGSGGGLVNEGRVTDEKEGRRRAKLVRPKDADGNLLRDGKGELVKPGVGVRSDGRGNAKGGGKRYRDMPLAISDELALKIKELADRRLGTLIEDVRRGVIGAADESANFVLAEKFPGSDKGEQSDTLGGNAQRETKQKQICVTCGRGRGRGWVRCPFHL
jgi:hypothetical protein